MYMTKQAIMNRLQEHYNAVEHSVDEEIFGIFLRGSQNYINEKFLETSDVDSVAVLIPTTKQLVLERDMSKGDLTLNDEKISRFDVRKFFTLLTKASIVNLESLFTEYFIINEKYSEYYNRLVEMREDIARLDEKKFVMSTNGESGRKINDLSKKEDYKKEYLKVLRLNTSVKAYIAGQNFKNVLKSLDEELIYKVRTEKFHSREKTLELAEEIDNETRTLSHEFKNHTGKNVDKLKNKMNDLLVDIITASL